MKKKDEILSMLYKLTVAVSELEDQAHVHVTNDVFPPDDPCGHQWEARTREGELKVYTCTLPTGHMIPRYHVYESSEAGDVPVPQWRALVTLASADTTGTWPYESALADILDHLVTVTNSGGSGEGCTDALARIVAVAEREVGDGWKADPDNWDRDWDDHVDIWIMLDALGVTEQRWMAVGDRAAAWLRDLMDGAS